MVTGNCLWRQQSTHPVYLLLTQRAVCHSLPGWGEDQEADTHRHIHSAITRSVCPTEPVSPELPICVYDAVEQSAGLRSSPLLLTSMALYVWHRLRAQKRSPDWSWVHSTQFLGGWGGLRSDKCSAQNVRGHLAKSSHFYKRELGLQSRQGTFRFDHPLPHPLSALLLRIEPLLP